MKEKIIGIGKGMSGFVYDDTNPESVKELEQFVQEIEDAYKSEYAHLDWVNVECDCDDCKKIRTQIAKRKWDEFQDWNKENGGHKADGYFPHFLDREEE